MKYVLIVFMVANFFYKASAQEYQTWWKSENYVKFHNSSEIIHCPECEDSVNVADIYIDQTRLYFIFDHRYTKQYMIFNKQNQFIRYYIGEIRDGKREGLGFNIDKKGNCFWGKWKNDKKESGAFYFLESDAKNRKKIVASFKNGKVDGSANLYLNNGEVFDVIYQDGREIQRTLNSLLTQKINSLKTRESNIPEKQYSCSGYGFFFPWDIDLEKQRFTSIGIEPKKSELEKTEKFYSFETPLVFNENRYGIGAVQFWINSYQDCPVFNGFLFNGKVYGIVLEELCDRENVGIYVNGKKEESCLSNTKERIFSVLDVFTGNETYKVGLFQNEYYDGIEMNAWKQIKAYAYYTHTIQTSDDVVDSGYSDNEASKGNASDEQVQEVNYETIEHPGVFKYYEWGYSCGLSSNCQNIDFRDGISGQLYKDNSGYYISNGPYDWYYNSFDDTVRALYVYKKYGKIIKRGMK